MPGPLQQLTARVRRVPLLALGARRLKRLVLGLRRAAINLLRVLPPPFSLGFPRGSYSDLALLTGRLASLMGRVILTDQGSPMAAPDSLLVLCGRSQHTEQPWPIFWTHHAKAELMGTSLVHVDAEGRLCEEAAYGSRRVASDPAYFFPRRLSRPVEIEGNWTSLVSAWMPIGGLPPNHTWPYGHWLQEALPRLALLHEFPADTQILLPNLRAPYVIDSLKLLGLHERCRWTTERHLRLENYYFSAPPSMIACYNPYAVRWIRDTFLPLVQDTPGEMPRRFFLRRTGDARNMINEAEVLDFFTGLGWEIVDAAQLSFAQQIRCFSCAEAICGIHGSGFINVVWSSPGCQVLELFHEDYLASEPEWICGCLPATRHSYLTFTGDHRLNARVDLARVRKKLEEMDLL